MVLDRFRDALGALLVGGPVALLSGWMAFVSLPTGPAATMTVGVVTATAALSWRRSHPLSSFAVVWLSVAVQGLVSGLFLILPSTLVLLVSVYTVMAYGHRRFRLAALACCLVGALLATWRLVTDDSVLAAGIRPQPVLVLLLLSVTVAAAGVVGQWRRTQNAYLAVLAERARTAERERAQRLREAVHQERRRIARDMHDIVAHSLSVMVSQARGGQYAEGHAAAVDVLSTIENEGRQALRDMRGLLGVLRDTEGSAAAADPQPGLALLPQLLERTRSAGYGVTFTATGEPVGLGDAAELAGYRLLQEALTNVVRHAEPGAEVRVALRWLTDRLRVEVANDGATAVAATAEGFGLLGMSERLGAVRGRMSTARPAAGEFIVTAEIPYPATVESSENP